MVTVASVTLVRFFHTNPPSRVPSRTHRVGMGGCPSSTTTWSFVAPPVAAGALTMRLTRVSSHPPRGDVVDVTRMGHDVALAAVQPGGSLKLNASDRHSSDRVSQRVCVSISLLRWCVQCSCVLISRNNPMPQSQRQPQQQSQPWRPTLTPALTLIHACTHARTLEETECDWDHCRQHRAQAVPSLPEPQHPRGSAPRNPPACNNARASVMVVVVVTGGGGGGGGG
jgi:hypothetical protein